MKALRAPKVKPFWDLRMKLKEFDISYRELRTLLNVGSVNYVVDRMNGRTPWSVADAYRLLDLIGEDESKLTHYFPRERKTA